MYCPRCAAQNLDDAKFCRGCGTGLETVALALSGRLPETGAKDALTTVRWLEERKKAVTQIIKALGLLASSLLLGVALGLFSNQGDWIFVWLVFGGWMACWGVISLISGVGSLVEARYIRKQLQLNSIDESSRLLNDDRSTNELLDRLPLPISVTEHTTRALPENRVPKSQS